MSAPHPGPIGIPGLPSLAGGLHTAWAGLLVDALAAAGVRDWVISPGSRSTPLVVAIVRRPDLRAHDVVDERSAGFFALGMARATGIPAALLCTSGTAGAHYFPAVIEASLSGVPLVVVTADRPFEHSGCGAPQAIDQVKLFGDHVRFFADVGTPDAHPEALRAVRRVAAQAAARARGPEAGPVHLNARFRKPLEPVADADDTLARAVESACAVPLPDVREAPPALSPETARDVARVIRAARRGLVVCGPGPIAQRSAVAALHEIAVATGFPLLVESGSQFRRGSPPAGVVRCDAFDAFLRSPGFRERHRPDLVLQIGPAPVSDGWARLVDENPRVPRVVLAPHGWQDPHGTAAMLVRTEIASGLASLARALSVRGDDAPEADRAGWAEAFARAGAIAREAADGLAADGSFWEGSVARAIAHRIPEGSLLALGNSLPIRDFDAWTAGLAPDVDVWTQRGANGIDGLISGASGAAVATGRATTLVIGDVSFLHDLHGLAVAREVDVPFAVVVVQNRGGRIFEQLPLSAHSRSPGDLPGTLAGSGLDEKTLAHWTTPHEADLSAAAALFGHRFARVESVHALKGALAEAHRRPGCTVIEAVVPAHGAATRSRELWKRVDARLVTGDGPVAGGGR